MVRMDPQSELLCKEVALRYNSIDGCYITSAGVVTGQVSNKAFSRANLASRIRIEADSMGLLHGQTSGKGLRGAMAAEDALRIIRDVLCIAGVFAMEDGLLESFVEPWKMVYWTQSTQACRRDRDHS